MYVILNKKMAREKMYGQFVREIPETTDSNEI